MLVQNNNFGDQYYSHQSRQRILYSLCSKWVDLQEIASERGKVIQRKLTFTKASGELYSSRVAAFKSSSSMRNIKGGYHIDVTKEKLRSRVRKILDSGFADQRVGVAEITDRYILSIATILVSFSVSYLLVARHMTLVLRHPFALHTKHQISLQK